MLLSLPVAFAALAALVALPVQGTSAGGQGSTYGYPGRRTLNHPYGQLLSRSIVNTPDSIKDKEFDFVIVGGGIGGLVLATRLTEWSNTTVLVIEAGGDGSDVADREEVPGFSYMRGLAHGSPYAWNYTTVAMPDSGATPKDFYLGRGLGGSGAINGMFWCRASSTEYDSWAALNPGGSQTWNWAEIDKYIKKSEKLSAPPQDKIDQFHIPINASAHGTDGPIVVGFSDHIYNVTSNWVPTWQTLGFQAKDLASGSTHGVSLTPSILNPATQSRSDSLRDYVRPNQDRPNLTILTRQQGTKILFDATKDKDGNLLATGVEFAADANSAKHQVKAKKEVIVAGGTVNSPKLLQLSGIGPQDVLSKFNIPVLVDLPVGHNYQDHAAASLEFNAVPGTETWQPLAINATLQEAALTQWKATHNGPLTYVNEAVGYASGGDLLGDALQAYVSSIDVDAIAAAVASKHGAPASVKNGLIKQYKVQKDWLSTDVGQAELILHLWGSNSTAVVIQVAMQHGFSRGTVFISSADAFAPPAINPDYFGAAADKDMINGAALFARKLATTQPLASVLTGENSPGADVVGANLTAVMQDKANTEFHPCSTCSMLPKDDGGVVDTNLRVYGTQNVRVVDASVIPIEISAHLMATTYGIAEKAADIIKFQNTPGQNATSSAPSSPNNNAKDTPSSKSGATSLNTGAKVGIALGSAIGGLLIIAALTALILRSHKQDKKGPASTDVNDKTGWYTDPAYHGGGGSLRQ